MVSQTKDMTSRIRKAFVAALKSSSWVDPSIREDAINRLNNITVYAGSPGRRLDPQFVEEFYKPLPDVPLNRTFPSWIKARSLSTHYFWADQSNVLYDEEEVNAYYFPSGRYILVPTAIIHRPFLYADVPRTLNYGALGMIIAHEFMHPFDVNHTRHEYWETDKFKKEYITRALCLRRSHRSVLSMTSHPDSLNDNVDSENIADFVGAMLAYKAFSSLPPNHRNVKLAGLNLTSEQLFFISHCLKWCADKSVPTARYAPYRSRCIVPLRNMPEFSSAFNCKTGTIMNPQQKCSFW
ncbi:hypothetical protein HPB50_005235 [Hyalomma asiaticum]|uniref:Uncharacterized protein n=1 Tax=Hyalomma asiaticum TaxID=266040 RepID=A0ACB7SGX1_HYAAI|nr:hypothetical protein HPB50_005235 [Hyalomma asiaticum]